MASVMHIQMVPGALHRSVVQVWCMAYTGGAWRRYMMHKVGTRCTMQVEDQVSVVETLTHWYRVRVRVRVRVVETLTHWYSWCRAEVEGAG